MKIYINNVNLNTLNDIQILLNDKIHETLVYSEIYTNESIYQVDNNKIYLLEPTDGDITVYQNYFNNVTLVVDTSFYKKTIETCINGTKHLHKKIKKNIIKLNAKSKLSFVIEMVDNLDNNVFVPNDVYFYCNELIDIKELFIKQEINEFLSLLN